MSLDQVLEVTLRLMMSLLTASPVMVTQVRFIIENLFLCHNVDKHFQWVIILSFDVGRQSQSNYMALHNNSLTFNTLIHNCKFE